MVWRLMVGGSGWTILLPNEPTLPLLECTWADQQGITYNAAQVQHIVDKMM